MLPRERFLRALRGEPVDRVPLHVLGFNFRDEGQIEILEDPARREVAERIFPHTIWIDSVPSHINRYLVTPSPVHKGGGAQGGPGWRDDGQGDRHPEGEAPGGHPKGQEDPHRVDREVSRGGHGGHKEDNLGPLGASGGPRPSGGPTPRRGGTEGRVHSYFVALRLRGRDDALRILSGTVRHRVRSHQGPDPAVPDARQH